MGVYETRFHCYYWGGGGSCAIVRNIELQIVAFNNTNPVSHLRSKIISDEFDLDYILRTQKAYPVTFSFNVLNTGQFYTPYTGIVCMHSVPS